MAARFLTIRCRSIVYREKSSGAPADRPELLRMIGDLQPGEVVVAERITLCAAHHTQVGRLQVADKKMSHLLLELWHEQHPQGHEQVAMDFKDHQRRAEAVPLFPDTREKSKRAFREYGLRALFKRS